MKKNTKKRLFIVAGTFFLTVGIIGFFVPVLPTTPFLLLTAACYARGSEHWHEWLLNNRWFGRYIKSYIEGKGMPLKIKTFTILVLWLSIGFTIAFGVEHWALRAALTAIAAGVTIHIIMIKPKQPGGN